jgi:F0F1-type ATP synthase membrane subunit b/b'
MKMPQDAPQDAFDKIRHAEDEAESILLSAKRKAADMEEEAEHEAERIESETALSIHNGTTAKLLTAKRENQNTMNQAKSSIQAERVALMENADARRQEAVSKIINLLKKDH